MDSLLACSGVEFSLFGAKEIRHASPGNRRSRDVYRVDDRGIVGLVGAGGIMAFLTVARPFIVGNATRA
jgi:hypothetical protein